MGVRVMPDFMAGFRNRMHQFRMTRSLLTDQKKRCVCLMLGESSENAGRVMKTRAVVNCQLDFALLRLESGDHAQQSLRAGNKDMIEHQQIGAKKKDPRQARCTGDQPAPGGSALSNCKGKKKPTGHPPIIHSRTRLVRNRENSGDRFSA